MSEFRKEKDCPSSFRLVELLYSELDGKEGLSIASHLASCDFCAAELEFYKHYPPRPVHVDAAPMPGPLLELAEALIANEKIHISRLETLLRDVI
jgi:hypothetical protein